MKNKRYVIIILGFMIGFLFVKQGGTQSINTQVAIESSQLSVGMDATQDMVVTVQDVDALYGFDISLVFDPQVVQVEDSDPDKDGVQIGMGMFLDQGFELVNQVDNEKGLIRLAMTQLNPSTPKSGDGVLLVARLRGTQLGQGFIRLADVQLAQPTGVMIEARWSAADKPVITLASVVAATAVPTQLTMHPDVQNAIDADLDEVEISSIGQETDTVTDVVEAVSETQPEAMTKREGMMPASLLIIGVLFILSVVVIWQQRKLRILA